MSILIKGMEMPEDCPMCPLSYWTWGGTFRGCNIVSGKKYAMDDPEYAYRSQRPKWCPLVPVPEHGRLIDADALRAKQQEDADLFQGSTAYGDKCRRDEAMNAVANIVNAPTIIPASFENLPKNARYSQDNPAEEGE